MSLCPFPGCDLPAPGRHAVFCATHHFQMRRSDARLVLRTNIALDRAEDADSRAHLRDQLGGYIASAIRHSQEVRHGA